MVRRNASVGSMPLISPIQPMGLCALVPRFEVSFDLGEPTDFLDVDVQSYGSEYGVFVTCVAAQGCPQEPSSTLIRSGERRGWQLRVGTVATTGGPPSWVRSTPPVA